MPCWAWYIAGVLTPVLITLAWLLVVFITGGRAFPSQDIDWRDGNDAD